MKEERINRIKSRELPALVSITKLSRFLGVGRTTIYEWLHSEQLPPPAKIINKRRYWTREQIEDFLRKDSK